MDFVIEESSLINLRANIRAFDALVLKEAETGLKEFGMKIIARSKQNLKDNGSLATGVLRNSGRVEKDKDGTIDVGFYALYAGAVEYGRRSGKFPPVNSIFQWIRKKRVDVGAKGKNREKAQRRAAFLIARSIAKNGTKARPFLQPAYQMEKDNIVKHMQDCINVVCNKYKGK